MSSYKANILIVDDELGIRELVEEILLDEGYSVYSAENAEEARVFKTQQQFDLILLDIWMPDTDGITLLKEWTKVPDFISPVVMMSGHGTIDSAVEATKLGAYDFLEKPLSLARLLRVVERSVDDYRLRQQQMIEKPNVEVFIEPIGHSVFVSRLKEYLLRLAQHDNSIIFTGEGGVGKALYAQYLYQHSSRRHAKFIHISVYEIEEMDFNELFFGREYKGKYSAGLFEQAQGGVLYLTGVELMSDSLQLKLLTALNKGDFSPVGSQVSIKIDVRMMLASKVSLATEVAVGRFNEALYYFLNQVTLDIVSLREHSEDIPGLLSFYVDFYVQHEKLAFRKFTMSAQNFLRNYLWLGNIRELKNLVQGLMILGSGNDIELAEVKSALGESLKLQTPSGLSVEPDFFNVPLKEARECFEKAYLEYHFEKNKGNVAKLAVAVGMERTHLYRKLHALNIKE